MLGIRDRKTHWHNYDLAMDIDQRDVVMPVTTADWLQWMPHDVRDDFAVLAEAMPLHIAYADVMYRRFKAAHGC